MPDITFLLKVDPKICVDRIMKDRFDIELYEEKKKLESVWKNYEWLVNKFNKQIIVIDAMKSEREVFSEIAKKIENLVVSENNHRIKHQKTNPKEYSL